MSENRSVADGTETLVEAVLTSTAHLVRRLRSQSNPRDLTFSQTAILVRLGQIGPATTADLARAESVKPQSMGATMALLQSEGLVQRTPHATDKRRGLYDLTDAGRAARAEQRLLKREWLVAAMATLSDEEKRALLVTSHVFQRLGGT